MMHSVHKLPNCGCAPEGTPASEVLVCSCGATYLLSVARTFPVWRCYDCGHTFGWASAPVVPQATEFLGKLVKVPWPGGNALSWGVVVGIQDGKLRVFTYYVGHWDDRLLVAPEQVLESLDMGTDLDWLVNLLKDAKKRVEYDARVQEAEAEMCRECQDGRYGGPCLACGRENGRCMSECPCEKARESQPCCS